jgi:methylmalonyl-CoA/ethylmalonyl-CoA epimerase
VTSQLHHVVFAVMGPRHDETAKLFNELGFHLDGGELTELGIRVSLDWSGGIERFRQQIDGEGAYLEEIDLSVLDLPLTLLATNVP